MVVVLVVPWCCGGVHCGGGGDSCVVCVCRCVVNVHYVDDGRRRGGSDGLCSGGGLRGGVGRCLVVRRGGGCGSRCHCGRLGVGCDPCDVGCHSGRLGRGDRDGGRFGDRGGGVGGGGVRSGHTFVGGGGSGGRFHGRCLRFLPKKVFEKRFNHISKSNDAKLLMQVVSIILFAKIALVLNICKNSKFALIILHR